MGDALHYIDFHQLQIENKQFVSRIEERNDELLKVRKAHHVSFMRDIGYLRTHCLSTSSFGRTDIVFQY